jgi:hypothetical protein
MNDATKQPGSDWWYVVSRWLEYEGEMRVALLRVLLVAAFYGVQLVHFLVFSGRTEVERAFQQQVTYLAAAWLFVSLAVLVMLSRRLLYPALKFFTTAADVVLVTAVAALGAAAASPMVIALGLLIPLAGLRGSLPLVWMATIGSMLAYMCLVGLRDENWFDADHRTPPVAQMVVLLTLAATGITVGQLLRMLRQIAQEMLIRQQRHEEPLP